MNPVKGQQVVTPFGNLISVSYIKENYSHMYVVQTKI